MDPGELDERYDRLLTNLVAARELLERADVGWWPDWLGTVHAEVGRRDARGLRRFLDGWGGMGGFNDLVIHPLNGHAIREEDYLEVNAELEELQTVLLADVRALLQDLGQRR